MWNVEGMWRMWKGRDIHTGFWRVDLKYRTRLEDLGIDGG